MGAAAVERRDRALDDVIEMLERLLRKEAIGSAGCWLGFRAKAERDLFGVTEEVFAFRQRYGRCQTDIDESGQNLWRNLRTDIFAD